MKWLVASFSIIAVLFIGFFAFQYLRDTKVITPLTDTVEKITEKPLEKYSFKRLKEHKFTTTQIEIGEMVKDEEDFASYTFTFRQDPEYGKGEDGLGLSVSGLMNVPKESLDEPLPVIIMFRGFVPRESYTPGEGTRRTGEALASNGYITLAPDFLSYGGSEIAKVGSIEDRFQTYTTALSLMSSIQTLPQAFKNAPKSPVSEESRQISESEADNGVQPPLNLATIEPDLERIGIWGHSNGGHIALSTLAISGSEYPTVLWNPVTKMFPYSILYFTDEFDDEGKALRRVVADFEQEYDVFMYSPTRYYEWIQAPIQLHQAVDDEAVPVRWSDQFVDTLEEEEKDIEYFKYPWENHNFNLGSWSTAISRTVEFYEKAFEK